MGTKGKQYDNRMEFYNYVNSTTACTDIEGSVSSLELSTTSSIANSSQGTGSKSILYIPNAALTTGTMSAGQSELYFNGATSDVYNTETSIHHFMQSGNSTGYGTTPYTFQFSNLNTDYQFQDLSDTPDKCLKVLINGTDYYIAVCSALT